MPPATDTADVAAMQRLVAAQAANRASVTRQAVRMAQQAARSFRRWYETDAITEWSTALAARIETLQRHQAATTDAHLARALGQMIGATVRPLGAVDVTALRAGVTHAGAYGRAADVYRWQQSQVDGFTRQLLTAPDAGTLRPPEEHPAVAAAQRIAAVADLDIQLADRAQSEAVLTAHTERREITGQRRIIHPELSKGGACGLCIAASGRVYPPGELRPIHRRCECTTLPIIGGLDPGGRLNEIDLGKLYHDAGNSTAREDLARTRYRIDEHGELGPVLTDGSPFRTARQAREDERRRTTSPKPISHVKLEQLLRTQQAAQEKARELVAIDATTWRPYADAVAQRIADLQAQLAA